MDTKTRRTEALELMALDELTELEAHRINALTANQQGFNIYFDLVENSLRDYVHSVDACLTLKLPPGCFWELYSKTEDMEADFCSAQILNSSNNVTWNEFTHQNSLPVAMLKAFWSMQTE